MDVYTKSGTYQGFETDSGAWTLVSSTTATGQGSDNPTPVDITDFMLSANSVTGIYINAVNASIRYTNTGSEETFSNTDLQLDLGAGVQATFASSGPFPNLFTPRIWNGTIVYEVQQSESVPEPNTIISLAMVGGSLLLSKRVKRG